MLKIASSRLVSINNPRTTKTPEQSTYIRPSYVYSLETRDHPPCRLCILSSFTTPFLLTRFSIPRLTSGQGRQEGVINLTSHCDHCPETSIAKPPVQLQTVAQPHLLCPAARREIRIISTPHINPPGGIFPPAPFN